MPWKRSGRTEIVHIVVTGYKKKKQPSKHYVFVIDVTWNNSDRYEVYRRYSDFFSFQTTLKALFPGAAGRRNNEERSIPQLPKRIFVGRSHVAKVAEARLEQINRYTQTLISLDPRISESAHVVGFFSPRIGDKELPKLHLHRPVSLHPSKIPLGDMFEEYCALAEYVAEDSSQISFKSGDKVLVMSKDQSGWWMCGVDGQVGWGPPSYLKKCCDITETESDESEEEYMADSKAKDSDDSGVGDNTANDLGIPTSSITGFLTPEIVAEEYLAIESYQAEGPGQISFEAGDTIHVLDKLEDGWWFVSNGKDDGWAPCSYLEGDKDEEGITNLEDIEKYYSVDDYEAEEEDEISFKREVVVDVLQKSLDGWWMIKVDKQVGLAPATFLKKVQNPEALSLQDSQVVRKVIPPLLSLPAIQTFQQPPRKQSVRARASMRARPTATQKSPLSKRISSPLPPITPDRPYEPPLKPTKKENPSKSLRSVNETLSPDLSDSDPDDNYLNIPFHKNMMIGKPRAASYSGSESSIVSEDGSLTGSGPKRPVATPRKKSPQLMKGGHVVATRSLSAGNPPPPLPPRPIEPPKIPSRSNVPYNSVDVEAKDPPRPKLRPRTSEIKRAKDRARAANPRSKGAPALMIVDEDGLETMSMFSARSAKSQSSNISSKSAPNYGKEGRGGAIGPGGKQKKKRSLSTDQEGSVAGGRRPQHLAPERPARPRHKSEGEKESSPGAVTTRSEGGVAGEAGAEGLNTQIADTLLRYIITSEDPSLKAALRDLISQDSNVVSSISEQ